MDSNVIHDGGIMKKLKFKSKYILGEGYPWFYGTNPTHFNEIGLNEKPVGVNPVSMSIPKELGSRELPKYQLILKRVKETKNEK